MARAEKLVVASCSAQALIEAIEAATAKPGPDTIALGGGCVYTLTSVNNDWYGPNGLPPIAGEVTIEGSGATIARGAEGPPFRFFFVGADPESSKYVSPGKGKLTLRNLVLSGGLAKGGDSNGGGGGAGLGGAIFSQGTVTVEGCTLTGNRAVGGSSGNLAAGPGGGGIGEAAPGGGAGGGFGAGEFGGGEGGGAGAGAAGGGAGFLGEHGFPGGATAGGAGGGPVASGLGGAGGGGEAGRGGDGSGGGAGAGDVKTPGAGGGFGAGGGADGGGGGVGGGGAAGGGGGGFGGGGGSGPTGGGFGGFGGGGGGAGEGEAAAGFGGGAGGSEGGGGAGLGGAIFNMQGTLTVEGSTFAGNSASRGKSNQHAGQGVAGAVFDLNGTFTSVGSTFAANEAADLASQIYTLALDESQERKAETTLRDTIVSGGSGAEVELGSAGTVEPNLSISRTDVSPFDLIRHVESAASGTVVGTPLTADPLLGELTNNGGPTPTMALGKGSPAIDAGDAFGLATDQRGMPRTIDFSGLADREGGDGTDIGAFEVQPACAKATLPYEECPAEPPRTEPPPSTKGPEKPPPPESPGTLSAVAKQKLGTAIVVSFLCKVVRCKVTIAADIVYGNQHLRVALKAKLVAEGRKQRFSISIPSRGRKLLAKALARHVRVIANVTAAVTYAEGRAKAGPLGVRLAR